MEELKHECGVVMIRLLKPLDYYHQRYGSWMYPLGKLYLLMEKQHNRGQEGAGLACVKLDAKPGEEYMFRERAVGTGAITEIFNSVYRHFKGIPPIQLKDPIFAKNSLPFVGELYMGHLRYSTTGKSGLSYIHPFLRRNNWRARNLVLCGNFNMTNVKTIFQEITSTGQHPRHYADTYIILEQLGHRLDREVEHLYRKYEAEGLKSLDITHAIEANIDLTNVVEKAASSWDGGYIIAGMTGSGESFTIRDPWGIRTAFYYMDDEIVVVASERPVIQTVMDVPTKAVKELQRGEALFISRKGGVRTAQILEPQKLSACSFERIYFSRGSDKDIYSERKQLGYNLVEPTLKSVDYDLEHTVFSFIPNTAEVAYYGMLEGLNTYLNGVKIKKIKIRNGSLSEKELNEILSQRIRSEKVALKDIKLRTFIAEGNNRNDLAAHVYDITYGSIVPNVDNLVVIDDSIVRGTTLKQSIISILDRLRPKKIVITSSSPQIRYPDYYGIDMSSLNEFIAFRAAIELLRDRNMEHIIMDTYNKIKDDQMQDKPMTVNHVKAIYEPFAIEEISAKMVELLTGPAIQAKVEIIFQTLEGLHAACPNHSGDWYFSGNYPTPGGIRMVSNAFVKYMKNDYLKKHPKLNFEY
ncbi:MAG: amidophosphoribosyltransferase [Dysgonamonadaceae bacterium]|jgi:amidophosphoribosyltransferase|nr:amidophosphoribosyltransferase [Dysgonamonadaceae bacterium]